MTRKQKRAMWIGLLLGGIALVILWGAWQLNDTIVYFYSPSDIIEKHVAVGRRIRIGGLVEKGSRHDIGSTIAFTVTDTVKTLQVKYAGVLPDLFREGQGVIAEGVLRADGQFEADSVLAKHDEKYMPPEVAAALKAKGVWRGADTGAKPAVAN